LNTNNACVSQLLHLALKTKVSKCWFTKEWQLADYNDEHLVIGTCIWIIFIGVHVHVFELLLQMFENLVVNSKQQCHNLRTCEGVKAST